jgi:hypothetical protein
VRISVLSLRQHPSYRSLMVWRWVSILVLLACAALMSIMLLSPGKP